MINKEDFLKLLKERSQFSELVDKLESIFGICEAPVFDIPNLWFEDIIYQNFSDEGSDWIFWYLYEKDGNKAYNVDGTEIELNTDEDLWNLVKSYKRD